MGPLLGANVTSIVFESKDDPTQMTKISHLQLYTLLHTENYTLSTHIHKCSQLKTVFSQTLGFSSVTQN